MFGIEGAVAEIPEGILIQQLADGFLIGEFYLVDLVRGAEAVEEMDKGNVALYRGKVRNGSKVCYFLNAACGHEGKACLTAVHNVGMIAENTHAVGTDGTGGYVQNCGQAFAGDAVQHGDHQHKTLRRCESSCQCARLQCTVNCGDSACFGLHFRQGDGLTEEVFLPLGGPCVCEGRHGRRGRDGVDGSDLRERICHAGSCFVSVHCYKVSVHI